MAQHQRGGAHEGIFIAQNLLLRVQSLQKIAIILVMILLCRHLLFAFDTLFSSNKNDVASRLAEPGTAYKGTGWHNERTVAVDTLGETKFARCDVHTVSG